MGRDPTRPGNLPEGVEPDQDDPALWPDLPPDETAAGDA